MFHERIKALRLAKGISQVDLAKRLGVTKQSVSNWENDNIQPSIEMLIKISRSLCVSSDYLLGLDDRLFLEVEGLDEAEVSHVQAIVNDIRARKT